MSAAGRQRANQSFRHAVRSAAALRWQVLKTTLMPAVPAGRPSAAIGAEARPFLARRNDPLAADLFGVQNSHARSRSPSRFPLHKLEATLPELPGKSAAEYEADPIYFIRCAWVEFCQNSPREPKSSLRVFYSRNDEENSWARWSSATPNCLYGMGPPTLSITHKCIHSSLCAYLDVG